MGRSEKHDRYKIVYTAVDGEPEITLNLLKRLVGERDLNLRPLVPNQEPWVRRLTVSLTADIDPERAKAIQHH
jgi:hypothetical protein